MLIKFIDVGRDKKTWEEDIPLDDGLLDGVAMVKAIRRKRALLSRGIECSDDGLIFAGERAVGRWIVSPLIN